jgi:hypothetical protein
VVEHSGDGRIDPEAFEREVLRTTSVAHIPLNQVPGGRALAARFVELFGAYVRDDVRPLLREVAADGRDAQLVVNGLAELLRSVASTIEGSVPGANPG